MVLLKIRHLLLSYLGVALHPYAQSANFTFLYARHYSLPKPWCSGDHRDRNTAPTDPQVLMLLLVNI